MSYSPSKILSTHLLNQELTDPPADPEHPDITKWPGYYSELPEEFDRCVGCMDTEPITQVRILNGYTFKFYGVTVLVRSEQYDYDAGFAKCNEIVRELNKLRDTPIAFEAASFTIRQVILESGPTFTGREPETKRPTFSANFLLHIKRTA